jgi:hypothetical protein
LPESNTPDPQIINPFHHFSWGDFWTYAPPPQSQYSPQSGEQYAVCNSTNNNTLSGSPGAGGVPPGGFGNVGVRASFDLFYFNATSVYVGCEDQGNDTCWFNAWAWKWDGSKEYVAERNAYRITPCSEPHNCAMQQIFFPDYWRGLIGMNFTATVQNRVHNFYMDTLELAWVNNTCAAGLQRISVKKRWLTA